MNERALRTLEFVKVRQRLMNFAVSPMGKEKAETLLPMTEMSDIVHGQTETTDAVKMILKKGSLPLGGLHDIRPQLHRGSMGGLLTTADLMGIGEFLYVCRKLKNYASHETKDDNFGGLEDLFSLITPLAALEKEINRCILSETEISDDASAGLRSVRKEIQISNQRIREHLNGIIASQSYRTMLQDAVITIRNDRYCVPVKSEYRNVFQGMVHDQSNTGSTVFIEPMSVVSLNNKIKELQAKEKEEIEKILRMLSDLVAENTAVLSANLDVIAHLDFVFAKGELSLDMEASQPYFNTKGYINIRKARHPLLDKKAVVPIDIYLGKEFTTLLITGPNTGGKTVALKTLGLFTLMGQSGLHIPAFDNSQLAVFDDVFADIGDEQSIEQNLSTFSAHMSNTVRILEEVTEQSLVLFDELGAGTDPTEGAALAMSIITHLHRRKIRTAVTTHYSELKVYAISTEGVENASCEFDVESLRPTYRLLIGVPGKSNAFAISKRLGLSEDIIHEAKEFISREAVKFEDVITDLEESKRTVLIEKERAESYRKEAERLKEEVEIQKKKTAESREKILAKAQEEARQVYQRAKEEADRIIKEINRDAKSKANLNQMNANRLKLKTQLSKMQEEFLNNSKKKKSYHKAPENLKEGDSVYIISFDQNGTVLKAPDTNGDVYVQTGMMKIKVPKTELMLDDSKPEKETNSAKKVVAKVKSGKSQFISSELDCRGMLVDECIGLVDKYIDDAYLAGLKKVTIIHGKGTGALRSAVQSFLDRNSHVKSHRPGMFGEGEMGVTVVELK
ncbi:MAG: endonuclease MutS2 [Clostridiales bacterium]|nr:endonuclease MutS2 [Clostridiales bacterium]